MYIYIRSSNKLIKFIIMPVIAGYSLDSTPIWDVIKTIPTVPWHDENNMCYMGVWYSHGSLPNPGRAVDSFKSVTDVERWFKTRQNIHSTDGMIAIIKKIHFSKKWIGVEVTVDSDTFTGFIANPDGLSTFAIKQTIHNNKASGHSTTILNPPIRIPCTPYIITVSHS